MSRSIDNLLRYFFSLPVEVQNDIKKRSSAFDDLVYLALALRRNDVHDAIEIGTFKGLSACFLASSITGTLYTYNVNPAEVEVAKRIVDGAGITNVQFVCGDSLQLLPKCPALTGGKLGAVYIDGHHSYRYSMGEYNIVAPYIKDGIIFIDDANKMHPDGKEDGGVPRTVQEVQAIKVKEIANRVAYKSFGAFKI